MVKSAQFATTVMVLFSLSLASVEATAQSSSLIKKSPKVLFSSFKPLNVRIEAPFNELVLKKNDSAVVKKLRVRGHLYIDQKTVPVEIRLRGYSSLYFCDFPKFTLYLDKAAAVGTPFEDIKKVDVATHCQPSEEADKVGAGPIFKMMKYNHREALLYKWLEILEVPAYASRPAYMVYRDTSIPGSIEIREDGFFLEHLDAFVKRAGGVEIRVAQSGNPEVADQQKDVEYKELYRGLENHPEIDRRQLARIAFLMALLLIQILGSHRRRFGI